MAVSEYDKKNLSASQQAEIDRVTKAAQSGSMSWADAHSRAEEIRNSAGYSGGRYGNEQITSVGTGTSSGGSLGGPTSAYTPPKSAQPSNGGQYSSGGTISQNKDDYLGAYNPAKGLSSLPVRPDLAGKSVKQGNYTITYGANGRATTAKQDGGASANYTPGTTHANDSELHQAAYQAAQAGDWDKAYSYINQINQTYGARNNPYEPGQFDTTFGDLYGQELQNQFRYNAENYYNGLYDKAYGQGSASIYDASGGAIKSYQQLAAALGNDRAQQIMQDQIAKNPGAYEYGNSNGAQNFGPPNQWQGSPGYPSGGGDFSGSYGVDYGGWSPGRGSDMADYLREMYEQNIAAEMAALKSAYEQNAADFKAQDDLISQQFGQQRNQLASQNELARMSMNEYAIMRGLNTGTSGQMALAQNAALQGGLANLGSQEAQAQAGNALEMAKLATNYRNAAAQAQAEGRAQLANALYEEAVRQEEMAWRAQQAAQEQANWEAKFSYQQQLDQWDQDFALKQLYAKNAGNFEQGGGNGGTVAGNSQPPRAPAPKPSTVNNGALSNAQVAELQAFYGAPADGLWGSASTKAAGGKTADQAWAMLKGLEQQVGMNRTQNGQANAIQRLLDGGSITETQAKALLKKFGLM